jgi:predicted protein tyrosine phosphatase
MMPGKADKPTQNSALQGISEQENFMIRVLFICHGNICRSPMAEYVMKDLVKKSNLSDQFHISSAATSTEEIGNPVHRGTREKLAQAGILQMFGQADDGTGVRMSLKSFLHHELVLCTSLVIL